MVASFKPVGTAPRELIGEARLAIEWWFKGLGSPKSIIKKNLKSFVV